MKTMACLISNQHVPNLLAVHAVKPDRLYFIVTKKMKDKEKALLNALMKGRMDFAARHENIKINNENSIGEVYSGLKTAYKNHPEDEWFINLTGGTKPMSIGAYAFSKDNRLKTLYIAEGNQKIAIDLQSGESLDLDYNVSTEEFLAGYGFKVNNSSKLTDNRDEAPTLARLAAVLTANYDDEKLFNLMEKLQELKTKKSLNLTIDNLPSLNNNIIGNEIAETFGLDWDGKNLTGNLNKSGVKFLTGKWLEIFVFNLILPFENKSIFDLNIGVEIGEENLGKNIKPGKNNEFDVSFMRDQSLCLVECKTGGQSHDNEANNTLYKIEAIKSGLRAIRINTYLATTSRNIIEKNKEEVKESIKNRCSLYGCRIVHGEPLKEMADMYLNNDPSLNEKVAKCFGLKFD